MIWQRYLFKEVIKTFFFFLGAFFFLYFLLDYSSHAQDFIQNKQLIFKRISLYYAYHFIKRSDLLIPLALLVASIKVLFSLNQRHELLALQSAGIGIKKILRPLFLFAALCSLFNYVSTEWILPKAMNYIDTFHYAHFRHSVRGNRKEPVHVVYLQDHSKLLYQKYDPAKEEFFDLFWVRSADEIWRIRSLNIHLSGSYVDRLERNKEGYFEKKESFPTFDFQEMHWNLAKEAQKKVPIENMSPSQLYKLYRQTFSTDYQKAEILTYLTFKILLPLFPLLTLLGIAPWCVQYSRTRTPFFLYALSLFSLLAFYVFLDAATILGANRILSPFWVIFAPFALCSMGFFWKFSKI